MDFCLYLPVLCTLFKSADHNVSLYKDLYLIYYLMNVNQILNLGKQFPHLPFIHSHTHTPARQHTHTRTRTHTHTRTHARTRTHTRTHTHKHERTRTRTRTHTHKHARTRTRTRTHTHKHARTHIYECDGTNIFFHALVYGNVNNTEKAMVMIIVCQTT